MSAITAKASRKMKKYAVLTREPRCFLGSFDFSWEQREVGDLLIERSQQAPMSDEYPLMAFIANEGVAPKGERYDRSALVTDTVNKLYKKTEKGDFIYSSNNLETGSIGLNKYGKACISPVYSIFEPTGIADSDFLGRRLVRKDFINAMVKWRQGVIYGQWRIHESDFLKIEISVPSVEEQRKIGAYLDQLDNLITLHQRKCALLFSPFQAFISMMFTTSTFSWEQRKFEEIAVRSSVICSDDTLPRVEYEDIVSGTGRLNKDIYAKQSSKSGIVFHQGDVLYGKLRPYLQNWLLPTFDGLAVGDFWVLQPQNADSSFLYRLIQSRQFDEVANQSTGTKMPRADWKLVSKTVFSIPSNISEQAAIGTYFTALDSLITLHQRKCIFFTGRAGRLISTVNKKRITSSWEQRKLASLCEKFTDGDWIESKDQSDFGVRLVQTGNVGVAEYLDKTNNKKWISEDTFDRLHCEEVLPGDILISRLPEPAGRACIVPLLGTKMITAVDCTIVRTAPDMSNKFLVQYLSSQAYFDDVNTCLAGGTRQRISRGNLANFNVPIPVKKSEQDAIGMFFGYLDNLITLHQRKFEKLTNVKKSMLEKMFPQNGSSYPEIRFKGFTDPWEQRKLGDMMNVTSVKRIHQSDWTDSGVRFLRARDIVAAAKNEEPDDYLYISKEKYEEYSTLSGKVGVSDLLVTGVGTIGVPYLVRNLEPLYFKDGNIIWFQNSDKIDGKFLFYSFSAEQIQGFINESAGIGTVGTYTIESGKKTPISLPNQIEQAKVGEFFQQLDNLITLHQRELEKLQNIKKSMLEKMFV